MGRLGAIAVFHSLGEAYAALACLRPAEGRCVPKQFRAGLRVFLGNSAGSGPSFFLRVVLALSGGTSFPGPPITRTGSIRVLLERNPPTVALVPGGASAFRVREQSR